MSYKSLRAAVNDLEKTGQLSRIKIEIDANLEMAEIHRRVYDAGGPALLFEHVKGSPFQAVSNIYGTYERTDFLFRHTIKAVEKVIELKLDPTNFLKNPMRYLGAPFTALKALPLKLPLSMAASNYAETTIDKLPQVKSWGMARMADLSKLGNEIKGLLKDLKKKVKLSKKDKNELDQVFDRDTLDRKSTRLNSSHG